MKFVQIGDTLVNLENVTSMYITRYDNRDCVQISFTGNDFLRVYRDKLGSYEELTAWIREQPALLREGKDAEPLKRLEE